MFQHILPALIAAALALLLTPAVLRLAARWGFVDSPDGRRKVQGAPVALGGGVVVLLAALVGAVWGIWHSATIDMLAQENWNWWGLLAAAAVLCIVGIADDRRPLPGKYKLLWQVIASSLVIGSGLVIERVSIFGVTLELGLFGFLLTMIWLLAAINSFNLIDGVDGLAAGIALIFSLTLGLMAIVQGFPIAALIALSIAGALCGFVPFNLPPAKIYLGDAGSMVLGLILGSLALTCNIKEAATVAFAAPLALWAIPIFDSLVAVARRTLTGRSIYATDRGHIHHRLLTRGFKPPQALAIVTGLCVVTSAAALASIYFREEWIGVAVAAGVIVALVATRVFGHVELLLLNNHLLGIGRSWAPLSVNRAAARDRRFQLQGTLAWETLWQSLVESAPRYDICQIRLNVNAPQLHEDFFATWERRERYDINDAWQIDLPIVIDGAAAGRLRVVGERAAGGAAEQLQDFLDFFELLQTSVADLAQQGRVADVRGGSPSSQAGGQHEPARPTPPTGEDAVAGKAR